MKEFFEIFVLSLKIVSFIALIFVACLAGVRVYLVFYALIDKMFIKSKFRDYYVYHVIAGIILGAVVVIGVSLLLALIEFGIKYLKGVFL